MIILVYINRECIEYKTELHNTHYWGLLEKKVLISNYIYNDIILGTKRYQAGSYQITKEFIY